LETAANEASASRLTIASASSRSASSIAARIARSLATNMHRVGQPAVAKFGESDSPGSGRQVFDLGRGRRLGAEQQGLERRNAASSLGIESGNLWGRLVGHGHDGRGHADLDVGDRWDDGSAIRARVPLPDRSGYQLRRNARAPGVLLPADRRMCDLRP
jgi:hypothetical protein